MTATTKREFASPNPKFRLEEILSLIGELCPDCMAKVRTMFAPQVSRLSLAHEQKSYAVLRKLLEAHAQKVGISVEMFTGTAHAQSLVQHRREFCRDARSKGYTLQMIGQAIGRHHTTVMHLLSQDGWRENKILSRLPPLDKAAKSGAK
jgi:chromosomal replication initiation ATPase DnaA